jgi:4-hydroxy-tetrahydrodipicolinate synthase
MLNRMDKAVVRPPLMKLTDAEIARLRDALKSARIEPEGAVRIAAE